MVTSSWNVLNYRPQGREPQSGNVFYCGPNCLMGCLAFGGFWNMLGRSLLLWMHGQSRNTDLHLLGYRTVSFLLFLGLPTSPCLPSMMRSNGLPKMAACLCVGDSSNRLTQDMDCQLRGIRWGLDRNEDLTNQAYWCRTDYPSIACVLHNFLPLISLFKTIVVLVRLDRPQL